MGLSIFVIYLKQGNYYLRSLLPTSVNFFINNVSLTNAEAKFPCKTRLHYIDFAT